MWCRDPLRGGETAKPFKECAMGGEVLATVKGPFDFIRFELNSSRTVMCSSVVRAFARY